MSLIISRMFFLLLIVSVNFVQAASPDKAALLDNFKGATRFSGFMENKGQLKDSQGNVLPGALFVCSTPGTQVYVNDSGLTYIFTETVEDESKGRKRDIVERLSRTKKANIIKWSRVDIVLRGAILKKENCRKEGGSKDFSQAFYPHCPDGITGIRSYGRITFENVYPGIDWQLYNSTEKGFKYDFIVHPGADPADIAMFYRSEIPLSIDRAGNIIVKTELGKLQEHAPVCYTLPASKAVPSGFIKASEDRFNPGGASSGYETRITFGLPAGHQRNLGEVLVIDPQLTWSSFFGGTVHEGAQSIAHDAAGNVTVVGYLASLDFPVFDPATGNYFQGVMGGSVDAFIIKFSNTGVRLWSTYYGGSTGEEGNHVTCDAAGNIYVIGYSDSPNLPLFNPGGGAYYQAANGGSNDAMFLKFDPQGVRLWATFYGGTDPEFARGICIDGNGDILITGATSSPNFPVLNPGGGAYFQGAIGGPTNAFMLRFTGAGVPVWATYLGGNVGDGGMSIDTDNNNNIFAVGYARSPNFPTLNPGGGAYFQGAPAGNRSGYITKFSSAGAILWSTFYGGNTSDVTTSVQLSTAGDVFIAGSGYSANLPMVNPGGGAYYQAAPGGGNELFILKFTNAGIMTWGTYYGGSLDDGFYCSDPMALDNCGNLYLGFETNSTDVPVKNFCPSTGFNDATLDGANDVFITRFSNNGTHVWASYIGGDGRDFSQAVTVDNAGNLFMSGEWSQVTNSATYPLVNPGGGAYFDNSWAGGIDDSYIMKFEPVLNPPVPSFTNAGCNCSGSATATIPANSCAGPPYTYMWSNGTTLGPTTGLTSSITNLCAGSYSVVVNDGACNSDTLLFTLTGTAGGYTVNIAPVNANCAQSNGSATASTMGGTVPFTYLWSSGASTSSATGLSAGIYSCTITDGSGCTITQTVSIVSSGGFTVAVTPQNSVCTAANGSASAIITGGSSPFNYLWSNGASTSSATGLSVGNYSCTVTDGAGCVTTQTFAITASSGTLTSSSAFTNALCNGISTGTASAGATGGNAPYTYAWSNGASASAATGLSAGTYSCMITDASGCTSTQTVTITQPSPVTVSVTNTMATCNNSDGTGAATASGGTGPYSYAWSNGASTNSATGLPAGTYSVVITDANGCTIISATTVANSNGPTATVSASATLQAGSQTTLSASGGVTYAWTPTYGLNDSTLSNPIASPTVTTTYCVFVYDASGCYDSACVTVYVLPEPVICGEFYLPNAFSPNGDEENDEYGAFIHPDCVKEYKLVIYNRWGNKIFESDDVTKMWNGEYGGLPSNPGVYAYYLYAVLTNGKVIDQKGNVSLVK